MQQLLHTDNCLACQNVHCERESEDARTRHRRWLGKDYGNNFHGRSRTALDQPLTGNECTLQRLRLYF